MAANPKKVFDVAKPGDSPPDVSSRPVVVGNKLEVEDPMMAKNIPVSDDTSDVPSTPEIKTTSQKLGSDEKPAQEMAANSATLSSSFNRVQVSPLSEQKAKDDNDGERPDQTTEQNEETSSEVDIPESSDAATVDAVAEQAGSKKEKDKQNEADKVNNEAIKKLVESKKYFIPIGSAKRTRNFNRLIIIILLVLLVAVVGLYLAIDAGLIKTNRTIPFDLIKDKQEQSLNTSEAAVTEAVTPPPQIQTEPVAPTPKGSVTTGTVFDQKDAKFRIDNKYKWKVTEAYSNQGEGGPVIGNVDFELPSGTKMQIGFDYGGRGGACQPDPNDKPHAAGNACPTQETLSAEKIVTDEPTRNQLLSGPGDIWLEHIYHTDTEGKHVYWTGLSTSYDHALNRHVPPVVNKPEMGLFVPYDFITGKTFYYTTNILGITDSNVAYFDNKDVKQIEEVLRTFRLYE